jgi:hypothetical protein
VRRRGGVRSVEKKPILELIPCHRKDENFAKNGGRAASHADPLGPFEQNL